MPQTSEKPLVSVVTATFNALEGLKATVQSVAEQTAASVEHIIIDGASHDGTREYLESLGGQVRWISEPDEGIADAMNKGIAMARGEWILILQAEDRFASVENLQKLLPALGQHYDIVACDVALLRQGGVVERRRARPLGLLTEFKMTNPHQGMLCRRNVYEKIGVFDPSFRIAMDYEFLLRAKRAGARLSVVPEILAEMPATGVSTLTDWPAMSLRLNEDRRLQRQHALTWLRRLRTELFWLIYMPFKRMKCTLSNA
ncbi:MAG: glycosyltransferase [Novosphingobium sp.]|nr:glycosyltransferase [Novosphingobium sp.]